MVLEKGHKLSTGRPKGSKNRITNDVRACFHKVYEEMGKCIKVDGKPLTGDQAFLAWARENQTEFYRLYGKMIPQTAELGGDILENFVDNLIFAEEQHKMTEGQVKVVDVTNEAKMGKDSQKPPINGVVTPQDHTDNTPSNEQKPDIDVSIGGD